QLAARMQAVPSAGWASCLGLRRLRGNIGHMTKLRTTLLQRRGDITRPRSAQFDEQLVELHFTAPPADNDDEIGKAFPQQPAEEARLGDTPRWQHGNKHG